MSENPRQTQLERLTSAIASALKCAWLRPPTLGDVLDLYGTHRPSAKRRWSSAIAPETLEIKQQDDRILNPITADAAPARMTTSLRAISLE